MTKEQLRTLIEEIRKGRPEGRDIDWKQQWHNLTHQRSKEEFKKDIAALANSCDGGPAHLIFGLKDGNLFDAPLPLDEAAVQQIIKEITPPPVVAITEIRLNEGAEEKRVSILTIVPPYDRPYVTKIGENHLILVRRGSSSGTASRFELDGFYKPRQRLPELEVVWEHWPAKGAQRGKGETSRVLPVPGPFFQFDDLPGYFQQHVEEVEENPGDYGYPSRERLEEYRKQAEQFIESLRVRENLVYWYWKRFQISRRAIRASVIFENVGTQVASRPKARIIFPDWLLPAKEAPEKPSKFIASPSLPKVPKSAPASGLPQRKDSRWDFLRTASVPIPYIEPQDGSYVDPGANSATFWATRIGHKGKYRVENPIRVVVLPTAPKTTETIRIEVRLFCEELSDWVTQELELQLADPRAK